MAIPNQPQQNGAKAAAPSKAALIIVVLILLVSFLALGADAVNGLASGARRDNILPQLLGYIAGVGSIISFVGLIVYWKLHEMHGAQIAQLTALERIEAVAERQAAIARKALNNAATDRFSET